MAPTTDEAGRGCTSYSESMATSECRECLEPQATRLEKNIINLTIEEPTGYQVPVDKYAATSSPVLSAEDSRPLGDILVHSKPTRQSTRGWKRLAREGGNSE